MAHHRPAPSLSLAATLLVGLLVGLGQALGAVSHPIDTAIYWRANLEHLYPASLMDASAYIYPPPLAQLIGPLHVLPWGLVVTSWTVACFAAFWYVARGLALPLIVIGLAGMVAGAPGLVTAPLGYLLLGNVQYLLTAAVVAGIRHPGAWPVAFLTKTGPGVGVLWFAARREWRPLAIALATTAIVVAVSFALAPALWVEWARFALTNYGTPSIVPVVGPPFPVRLAIAAALIVWGSRTDRAWVVPIACALANPAFYGLSWVPFALGSITLASASFQLPRLDWLRRRGERPAYQPA